MRKDDRSKARDDDARAGSCIEDMGRTADSRRQDDGRARFRVKLRAKDGGLVKFVRSNRKDDILAPLDTRMV